MWFDIGWLHDGRSRCASKIAWLNEVELKKLLSVPETVP